MTAQKTAGRETYAMFGANLPTCVWRGTMQTKIYSLLKQHDIGLDSKLISGPFRPQFVQRVNIALSSG